MLLRGANAVGYTSYPDNVIVDFVREAHEQGIDIFRIFDSLNSIENMRVSIDAVLETGAVCEPAICYTGDMFDKTPAEIFAEILRADGQAAWKSWARISWPSRIWPACASRTRRYTLVKALREEIGIPIHFHTHDTSGINSASLVESRGRGRGRGRWRDRVHERRHQPAQSEFRCRSAARTRRATPNSTSRALNECSDFWEVGARLLPAVRFRTEGPAPRVCTSTKFPVANSRICANRPRPWDWAIAGAKWKKPMRK